eukprot:5478528-Ditylum_brightwellii.AAC.1
MKETQRQRRVSTETAMGITATRALRQHRHYDNKHDGDGNRHDSDGNRHDSSHFTSCSLRY